MQWKQNILQKLIATNNVRKFPKLVNIITKSKQLMNNKTQEELFINATRI